MVNADTDALLRRLCAQTGGTQTGVIRQALELLAKEGLASPSDIARRLGLIGAFSSTSGDVAEHHSSVLKSRLREQRTRDERSDMKTPTQKSRTPGKRV